MAAVRRNIRQALMNRAVPRPRFLFGSKQPNRGDGRYIVVPAFQVSSETMVEIVGLCGDAARATKSTLQSQKPEYVSEV